MKLRDKFFLLRDLAAVKLRHASAAPRSGTLVIRLDRIGDFALYAPFAHAARIPGEKTYFLVNSLWAELCTKLFPEAEIIPLAPQLFLRDRTYRGQMLKQVAALNVKRVLQPRFYRELLIEEMLCAAAAPERCIQFAATPQHLQYSLLKHCSSPRAIELEYIPGEHELERNLRFAKKCDPNFELKNPWLDFSAELPENFTPEKYICIFPGSGKGSYCCWQNEKWSALLDKLKNIPFLICGTPAEKEMMDSIASHTKAQCRVLSTLSLTQFAAVTAKASCVIGNDTGGIHLAAVAGVPALAISGRGQPNWFLPYPDKALPPGSLPPVTVTNPCQCENCFWRCQHLTKGICRCIDSISVRQVLEAMEENNFSALR